MTAERPHLPGPAPFRALVIATSLAAVSCGRTSPLPPEIDQRARENAAATSASAAAAIAGVIPLGARAVVKEVALTSTRPDGLCAAKSTGSCSLDVVDLDVAEDVSKVNRDMPVRVIGWAADVNLVPSIPPVVFVELEGGESFYYAPAVRLTPRPDVARVLGAEEYTGAGYDARLLFHDVPPGKYSFHVVQIDRRGNALRCDTRRVFQVE